ncbi:MAG: TonB-dependent receptor [Gammaproteobacteria bacterium]|nr:TonB-dependent receptor [Gammaproteobacteria bacterium]
MNKFQSLKLLAAGSLVILAPYSEPALSAVNKAATEIPAVIVSAARTEQSTLTTPASITVISRKQIDDSGANHIVEVLRGQGGIIIDDLYGDGSRASVNMRGFGDAAGSNVLVLVDGRRLNNPDIAAPDLNSIALDDVERIEIVQGSAGVLFGDQAVAGVINIITRQPGALRHSLKLSAGSYNTVDLHGMTSQSLDNGLNYRLSLDLRDSDNYRDHNESSYVNGFAKLGYEHSSGSLFAEIQYIDDRLNTPGTLFADEMAADRRQVAANYADDFSNTETTAGRLGLVQALGDNWSFEGELTQRDTDGVFRLSSVFGMETQDSTQERKQLEFTPRLIGFIPSLNNTMLTLGADVVETDYRLRSRFGEQVNNQSIQSLYIQAVIPAVESLDVTVGARYASVSNELSDGFTFNNETITDDVTVGTFGMAYQLNKEFRVVVRADQNFRFAKVDEFTNAQPYPAPPSTVILKTQEGLSLETGVEWNSAVSSAKFIVYQLELDNELAYDPVNYININLDETRRSGFTGSGRWQASQRLGLTASYTYTDAEVLSGAFSGKEIPFVARHNGLLGSDYQLNDNWQLYGEWLVVSDRVYSGDFDNVLARLPGYGLVNIKAEYRVRDFTFSGRLNNVFDKQYSDVGQLSYDPNTYAAREAYFPSPEINFLLTAAWAFR